MRQFYRQGTKSIDRDRERYSEKCLKNAYNRYKGICKKTGIDWLEYEEWLTTVNDRQRPSTMVNDQIVEADETDQLQQQLQTQRTTPMPTNNTNRKESAERETTFDDITKALESGKITVQEAVALRLQRR